MFAIVAAVLFFLLSLGWVDRSNDVVDDMVLFAFAFFVLHFGWEIGVAAVRKKWRG